MPVLLFATLLVTLLGFTNSASADTVSLTQNLQIGSIGSEVVILQRFLNAEGFFFGRIDGRYGRITARAVGDFQEAVDLPITEKVDAVTRAKINASIAGGLKEFDTTDLPEGCTSTQGYSPTTGVKCDATPTTSPLPQGCFSTSGYSVTTGQPCGGNTIPPVVTYPGFFINFSKTSYSPTENVVARVSRADGSNVPYSVDTYLIYGDNQKVPLRRVSIGQGTKIDFQMDQQLVAYKGPGEYTLLLCDGGKVCNGGVNTNSSLFTISYSIYPPGCTSTSVYSSTTGEPCGGTTSTSSITVMSPNGGENFTAGNSLGDVYWNSANLPSGTGIDSIRFSLTSSFGSVYELAVTKSTLFQGGFAGYYNNNGESQVIDLKIPATVPAGQYKLKISCGTCFSPAGDYSDQNFTILASTATPSITVTKPVALQKVTAGSTLLITWSTQNISANKLMNLSVYPGSGSIPSDTLTSKILKGVNGVPNTGSYTLTVPPETRLQDYSLQVICATCQADFGVQTFGWSPKFTVVAPVAQPSITVTSPNVGETYKKGTSGSSGDNLSYGATIVNGKNLNSYFVYFTERNDASWRSGYFQRLGGASGTDVIPYSPYNLSGGIVQLNEDTRVGTYYLLVEVTDSVGNTFRDFSDQPFTIIAPTTVSQTFNLTYPGAGTVWTTGARQIITWTSSGLPTTATISVNVWAMTPTRTSVASMTAFVSDGSVYWTIPTTLTPGNNYQVTLSSVGSAPGPASGTFSIVTPESQTMTITSPASGDSWAAGSTHPVTWTTENIEQTPNSSMVVRLFKSGIYAGAGARSTNDGTESVNLPATLVPGDDYTFELLCYQPTCLVPGAVGKKQASSPFTIVAPTTSQGASTWDSIRGLFGF